MISPEVLRRYPFFGPLNDSQLKEIAMISEEESYPADETLFEEGDTARDLFLLLEGSVDLFYTVGGGDKNQGVQEIPVSHINPGEPFSISALIEPHVLTSSCRTNMPSKLIRIDGESLRKACAEDKFMCYTFMRQVAKAAMERLNMTRVQLAAAWAD